jgi:hypothetical protein
MRLTEEQRLKLMMASSGMPARKFWDLGEDGQAPYMEKLHAVIDELVETNPDAFRGSVVKRHYTRRKNAVR